MSGRQHRHTHQRPRPSRRRRAPLAWIAGLGLLGGVAIAILMGTSSTPGADGDPVAGRVLFEANCARCHGIGAVGTDSGPPLVHEYYLPDHHADAAFLLAARNGVRPHHWNFGPMPVIEGLTHGDVDDVVAYVRSLQREAGLLNGGT